MLVPVEDSFLTSLNADRKKAIQRQQRREELLESTESGALILKLHNDLQGLADDLDERVEHKLNENEKAFFYAYKTFMYTVQKDFKELKQKADEEETKTRRDAKIQSLEKELDWFMNEALRLDELCKKYKKDLDRWKEKAEALEDDRQFLENQIKSAKRSNKALRGAVEQAQTSAYVALVSAESAPAKLQEHSDGSLALATFGLAKELEARYQETVKKLKQQLEQEQRTAAKLRGSASRQFGEPSQLEDFFVGCVDKVKAEIVERKSSATLSALTLSQGSAKASKSKGYPVSLPTISLDDFSASDRRKVVELLLSSEQVLQFLYDKLFPQAHGSQDDYGA